MGNSLHPDEVYIDQKDIDNQPILQEYLLLYTSPECHNNTDAHLSCK